MNSEAIFLQFPEKSHLSLCKLMNSTVQTSKKLFFIKFALQVKGCKLIFQAVKEQLFRTDPLVEQSPYFVHQTSIQPLDQPACNARTPFFYGEPDTNDRGPGQRRTESGRASCRERVCQYG